MKRIGYWGLVCILLLLAAYAAPSATANGVPINDPVPVNANSPLGINLTPLADWSSEYAFLNPFKQSRPWIPQNATTWDTGEAALLDLDANGWVRSLPAANAPVQYRSVATIMFHAIGGHYPPGQYVVMYDGEGTLEYSHDAAKDPYLSTPGRDVVHVNPGFTNTGFVLKIMQTDPKRTGNYIRNIRVQLPGQATVDPVSGMFHPDFIDSIARFRVVRFMDWMRTNWDANGPIRRPDAPQKDWQHPLHAAQDNPYLRQRVAGDRSADQLIDWSARPKVGDARYTNEAGVPAEVMIALANTADVDPWFNIPHNASDDYIYRFAELTRATLEPQRRVYIEYSNEVWNAGFYQALWIEQQAIAEWPNAGSASLTKRLSWYGKRSVEMCQLWKVAFADQAGRVVCVISGQANNFWIAEQMLDCPLWSLAPCHARGIDAIAIAPYFGGHIGQASNLPTLTSWLAEPDGGLNKLFAELEFGNQLPTSSSAVSLIQAKINMGRHVSVANGRNLALLAYEGGQHLAGVGETMQSNDALTQLFIRANRDPRMAALYADYFDHWAAVGGQFHLHYAGTGVYSKFGSWGAQEYITATDAVKREALDSFIDTHDCTWALCEPGAPSGATAVTLTRVNGTNVAPASITLLTATLLGVLSAASARRRAR